MFESGDRVCCANGDFDPLAKYLYRDLPIKDSVYTIRECTIGRTRTGSPDKGVSYLVLLVEVTNGPDPYQHPSRAEELGFRSDRFAPMVSETEHSHTTRDNPNEGEEWKPEPEPPKPQEWIPF